MAESVDEFNHKHDWESMLDLIAQYKVEQIVPHSICPLYDHNSRLRGFIFELKAPGAIKI